MTHVLNLIVQAIATILVFALLALDVRDSSTQLDTFNVCAWTILTAFVAATVYMFVSIV